MIARSRLLSALFTTAIAFPTLTLAQMPDVVEVFVSGVKNAPFPTIQGDHRRDFAFASLRGASALSAN
jgi:hypothetical protein